MLKAESTGTYKKYVHISGIEKKIEGRGGFPKSDVIKKVGQAKSDQIGLR
jgi:hypothetical protein